MDIRGAILALIQLATTENKQYATLVSSSWDETIIVWRWNAEKGYSHSYILHQESNLALSLYPLILPTAFISGSNDGTVKIWWLDGIYHSKSSMIHMAPVNAVMQLPTGELISGFGDRKLESLEMNGIRIWSEFSLQKSCFDISFANECAATIVLTQTMDLVRIVLQRPESIEVLHHFLQGLFYNCYARNFLLYDMQGAILVEKNTVTIQCSNEKLTFKLYNCLYALFFKKQRTEYFLNNAVINKSKSVAKSDEVRSESNLQLSTRSYPSLFAFRRGNSFVGGNPAVLQNSSSSGINMSHL